MDEIKIGNRIANVIYYCTYCDCSSLTKEAFGRHNCEDYPKEKQCVSTKRSRIDYDETRTIKRCWSLDNLQPKRVMDNIKKGNRYSEPTLNQCLQES